MMNNTIIMIRDKEISPNFAGDRGTRKRRRMHDIRIELPKPISGGGSDAAAPSSPRA
jgi:hypothetical protein